MNPPYINAKDFVEGKKDLREWPAWWRENERDIELNEDRMGYLKIKPYLKEEARSAYRHDEDEPDYGDVHIGFRIVTLQTVIDSKQPVHALSAYLLSMMITVI